MFLLLSMSFFICTTIASCLRSLLKYKTSEFPDSPLLSLSLSHSHYCHTMYPRLASNLWFSCFSFLHPGITILYHHHLLWSYFFYPFVICLVGHISTVLLFIFFSKVTIMLANGFSSKSLFLSCWLYLEL